MIGPHQLEGVRKAIRKFLLLRDDDPVDLVMLASVLANFAPDRDVPVWLVIVSGPASAKTDLLSLIADWKYTWQLPDVLTEAYFFSSKTGSQSALDRLQAGEFRILYSQDMGGMMDMNRLYAPGIYQQLRGIHDGFLRKETGYDSRPQTYGEKLAPHPGSSEPVYVPIPAAKRMGWLGSATPEFYAWQARHHRLGGRFTSYLFQPFAEWDDYHSLTQIDQMRAEKAHWRPKAQQSVQAFLDSILATNFAGFETIRLTEAQSDRISAAVKLVNKVSGTRTVVDTGARLHPRIVSMCRTIAFMSGKHSVTLEEIKVGLDIVMSQLAQDDNRIINYALHPDRLKTPWPLKSMLLETGLTRRHVERNLESMVDVGVLLQTGSAGAKGFMYVASPSTVRLAKVMQGLKD